MGCPDDIMIPFDEALRLASEACAGRRVGSETTPVRAALGRVLRADQRAVLTLPPFDKSAVDGFALGRESGDEATRTRFDRIVGVVHAGDPPPPPLEPATAVKVMTGAPVPAGTERVVMVEHAEVVGDRMRVARADSARNICRRGEDLRPGDLVLSAGTILRPLDLANLVSAGIAEVEVSRPVRVAILSTGDEIVDDVAELVPGRIMNSNGPMLSALASGPWLERVRERRVADTPHATREAIAEALAVADLVILTGGVSEGDSDHVAPALEALGARTLFTRVAVKPGKPLTFAVREDGLVLGLPGNPVSAYLMFHLFARRIAAHLAGATPGDGELLLPLAAPYRRTKAARLEFVPARFTATGAVEPIRYHGSAHLSALTSADGFFRVPTGVTDLEAGSEVLFHRIDGRAG